MLKSDSYGPIRFELRGDGFLTVTVDEEVKEIDVTLELAKAIIDASVKMLDGTPCPFLFLYKDIDVTVDHKASRYISSHPELIKVKVAEAIVTDSLANRLVVNWFTYFFKPPAPVKVFKREEDARKWLSKFL